MITLEESLIMLDLILEALSSIDTDAEMGRNDAGDTIFGTVIDADGLEKAREKIRDFIVKLKEEIGKDRK